MTISTSAKKAPQKDNHRLPNLSSLTGEAKKKWMRWLNFSGSYKFINRSKGSQRLLIVLAGYKDFLWPLTLERIAKFVTPDIDVCIVSSGLYVNALAEFAQTHNWSYLYTKTNKVALVQNLAIANHPKAKWIYKLDEDIFVTEGLFDSLLDGYLHIKQEGLYQPGICAPIINVNGYSYIPFLKIISAEDEYKDKFGELKHAASDVKAQFDGEAAKWLWQKSLPLDEIGGRIRAKPLSYSPVPHRFSIGAILFEREFWEKIGGLRTSFSQGGLGLDEAHLCKDCMDLSRPILVINNTFVGHFSFGPQEAAMKEYLSEIYPQLCLNASKTDAKANVGVA
ncbi:hypothetical protein [Calothrix sp. CCY 0018]|uniref:hypothetical protein n=1 Tax=Calothrix sp. CCY 0018 TaxID=3103864 RepID=UPI0039C68BED